jgi:hypothetical protein
MKSFIVKMNFISYVNIRGSRWLYTSHANSKMLIESDTFSHGYHCIFDGVEIVCHSLVIEAFFQMKVNFASEIRILSSLWYNWHLHLA